MEIGSRIGRAAGSCHTPRKKCGVVAPSLASQAQVGVHSDGGAGAHARAATAVNHVFRKKHKGDTTMTMAVAVMDNRTTDTVRPRRSLEELVDRLMDALTFKEEAPQAVEPSPARSIHEARRLRQAGDVAGGTGDSRQHGHDEGGDSGGPVGLLRVEATREAALRRPRHDGLQPMPREGRRAGASPRRDAGGRGGSGDALAAGQGRLGTQPPGSSTSEGRCVMVAANEMVDIPRAQGTSPARECGRGRWSEAARQRQGPPGRLPLPRRIGGLLHRIWR